MNYIESITNLLHTNHTKFFTDIEAYKKGYIKDDILEYYLLNKNSIIENILINTPHLLYYIVLFEGKFNFIIENIPVYNNLDLYTDDIIISTINENNLFLYFPNFDLLNNKIKNFIYTKINIYNITLIFQYNINIPLNYLNDEIIIPYIQYKSTQPYFVDFLIELNNPLLIWNNYNILRNDIIDNYLLKNVTMMNDDVLNSIIELGIPLKNIIKYKPQSIRYIINKIYTLGELEEIVKNIPLDTPLDVIEDLYKKFPYAKPLLNKIYN